MTPAEFMRKFETSSGAGGLDSTLALIDDAAVYWFSDGTAHVGKSAIERVFRRNAELIKSDTYRISNIVWIAQSSEFAACVYRFDWAGTIAGEPASGSGRGTSVLRRRGDGWVIIHEHLSKGEHAA